jgi:hypothetical protein
MSKQSLQDLFDKSTAGVLAQGKGAIPVGGTSCFYRLTEHGKLLKCALGQVITDEQMTKHGLTEGVGPRGFSEAFMAELLPGVISRDARMFLGELQEAHDNAARTIDFLVNFKVLANHVAATWDLVPIA